LQCFKEQMSAWIASGAIQQRQNAVEGPEKAPEAFMGRLEGKTLASWRCAAAAAKRRESSRDRPCIAVNVSEQIEGM
jgi:hypothetical protein